MIAVFFINLYNKKQNKKKTITVFNLYHNLDEFLPALGGAGVTRLLRLPPFDKTVPKTDVG